MNYGQFLYMVPEATLMAILVVAFIADFISSKHAERKWFNPLMCLLMLGQVVVSFLQTDTVQAGRSCHQDHLGRRNTDRGDSGPSVAASSRHLFQGG